MDWTHSHPNQGAIYSTGIFLGGRRKQGNMEETHADTKNMQATHTTQTVTGVQE